MSLRQLCSLGWGSNEYWLAASMATPAYGMFRNPDGLGGSNLGCVGFLVVVFVSANLAARIMSIAVVCLAYGTSAYGDGLRIASWKLGTLSDGSELQSPWDTVLGLGTF